MSSVRRRLSVSVLVGTIVLLLAKPAPAASGDLHALGRDAQQEQTGRADKRQRQSASSPTVRSRSQQIVQEQTAKASFLRPYKQSALERVFDIVQDLVIEPPPLHPWYGSVYSGGQFALGAGYRKPYGRTGLFQVRGGWSVRNYKGVELSVRLAELADRRLRFDLHGELIDAPGVAFYGVGQDTVEESATSYLYRPASVSGRVTMRPLEHVSLGGGAGYTKVTTGHGASGVSIEDRFTPETAPGLDADPGYIRSELFAGIDSRTAEDYTDRGGWYHVEWHGYHQRDGGPHSFRRLDAEVRQFIPILRANWVIALRALVSITDVDEGDRVPHFLLPALGGSDMLRGYPSWRFRDRHRILTSAEYRWKAGHFVDMALFLDAGKVVGERSELDFNGLVKTYGIGVRFHAPRETILRIEAARTADGFGLVFTTGQSF